MEPTRNDRLKLRKDEHIDICLNERVQGRRITTGLEKYRFVHNALPELRLSDIDATAHFLGKRTAWPFLMSSMTGGTERAAEINANLGAAAERRGWALGVGSMRTALEHPETAYSYDIRKVAPSIPLIANLGAVQLNYGYGIGQCQRAVEMIGADALVLHLNGLQEVFQPEGNTDFSGLLGKIESVCRLLDVPVGVKEVGWGIGAQTAERLSRAGVRFIDVAGAGGTSWIEVEKFRTADELRFRAADAFADWGIPTADCVVAIRSRLPEAFLIASGGIHNGVEAAKCIALGADLVGLGRALLHDAAASEERLEALLQRIEFELRAAMFAVGAGTLQALRGCPLLAEDRISKSGDGE